MAIQSSLAVMAAQIKAKLPEESKIRRALALQSPARQAIYAIIANEVHADQPVPTLREIGDKTGLFFTGIGRSVDALIEARLLKRTIPDDGRERSAPRSYTLTDEADLPDSPASMETDIWKEMGGDAHRLTPVHTVHHAEEME